MDVDLCCAPLTRSLDRQADPLSPVSRFLGKFGNGKRFPRDKQSLLIEFSLEPSEGGTSDSLYENFRFSPVTAYGNSPCAVVQ